MTNFERAIGRMNLQKTNPAHTSPESNEVAVSADRIDMVIAVFAFGLLFGMVIA